MKKSSITLGYDEERLSAARLYLKRRGLTLEEKMAAHLDRLYEKYVPQATREYLDDKIAREGAAKPARSRRQTEESHARNQTGQELE